MKADTLNVFDNGETRTPTLIVQRIVGADFYNAALTGGGGGNDRK